jgi:hypothetical protein
MTTQMIELLPLCFPLGNEQPARGMACHKSPLVQYAAAQPGNAVLLVKQPQKSDTNRLRHGVHGSITNLILQQPSSVQSSHTSALWIAY